MSSVQAQVRSSPQGAADSKGAAAVAACRPTGSVPLQSIFFLRNLKVASIMLAGVVSLHCFRASPTHPLTDSNSLPENKL